MSNELASVTEIAEILGVPKRTAQRYIDRPDFPPPVDELAVGRIWRRVDVAQWGRDHLTTDGRLPPGPLAAGPQVASFAIATPAGRQSVSISRREASRLLRELTNEGTEQARGATRKLSAATQLYAATTEIRLSPGEGEAVLRALEQLARERPLGPSLGRLERELRASIDA